MLLMNKEILLKDLNIKDYKETWDYQTNLLQEIVDTKINNRKSNFQVTTKNHFLFVKLQLPAPVLRCLLYKP